MNRRVCTFVLRFCAAERLEFQRRVVSADRSMQLTVSKSLELAVISGPGQKFAVSSRQ